MYDVEKISAIKNFMVEHGHTMAVAESVTAGHIQAALSLAENASRFFQGGITAYNLGQKSRHLKVDPIHAASCNCVSEKIAEDMAIHALSLFSSDWSVGITGYATPVPEQGIEDLFAFYAIAFRNKIVKKQKIHSSLTGTMEVQVYFTAIVLQELYQLVQEKDNIVS